MIAFSHDGQNCMNARSPGDIILNDALKHLNIGQAAFSNAMGMSPASISRMLSGKAAITPETALRLEAVLKEPAEYWMGLQAKYELSKLRAGAVIDASSLTPLQSFPGATQCFAMLTEIFHQYRDPDARIPTAALNEVCKICGTEALFNLMRRVDPQREVFDYPYAADERGMHGLLLLHDVYDFCSSQISDDFEIGDYPFPESFLKTFAEKRAKDFDYLLYRSCHLAWNKSEGVPGFLVMVFVGNMAALCQRDLKALSERFADVVCYLWPTSDGKHEHCYLTAFVRTTAGLKNVPKISAALESTAEKWMSKSVKNHNRDRTYGDNVAAIE
jgi:addiction module HigA family antidote